MEECFGHMMKSISWFFSFGLIYIIFIEYKTVTRLCKNVLPKTYAWLRNKLLVPEKLSPIKLYQSPGRKNAGMTKDIDNSEFNFYSSYLILSLLTIGLKLFLQLFSIIVFGCVSSSGWFMLIEQKKEVCVMNTDSSAVCHYSTFVGIIGFLAAIGFLVGEW